MQKALRLTVFICVVMLATRSWRSSSCSSRRARLPKRRADVGSAASAAASGGDFNPMPLLNAVGSMLIPGAEEPQHTAVEEEETVFQITLPRLWRQLRADAALCEVPVLQRGSAGGLGKSQPSRQRETALRGPFLLRMEATGGFEPPMGVLQTPALPLGHVARNLVPRRGFEPLRPKARPPQDRVSTYSTTSALRCSRRSGLRRSRPRSESSLSLSKAGQGRNLAPARRRGARGAPSSEFGCVRGPGNYPTGSSGK